MGRRLSLTSVGVLAAVLGITHDCAAYGQSRTVLTERGRIEGGADVLSLGAPSTGTISQVLVKAGDHVQAGQNLLKVECRDLENEVVARQSDLAAAEATFARVTHGSRPEE